MTKEWWEDEYTPVDYNHDHTADHNNAITKKYSVKISTEYSHKIYSEEEKQWLRPIAETLALLDGNGFLSMHLPNNREWYEQYLPDAAAIFYGNGGLTGWAGEASWIKELKHKITAIPSRP